MATASLTSLNASELRPTFEQVLADNPKRVVVDLSALDVIDSSGVGALVSLFKRTKGSGGSFQLRGLRGQPLSIFKVLRLDRVFDIA